MENQKKGKSFAARTVSHNDFPTHQGLTRQFLDVEKFNYNLPVREPAAGDGFMSSVLEERFRYVWSTDINRSGDFCLTPMGKVPYIITNCPYGDLADKFVIRAKQLYTKKIGMLLRINFLSGKKRFDEGVRKELQKVYIFTRMPDFSAPLRSDGKYPTAAIVYAWFVWKKGYKKRAKIYYIDNQEYVLNKNDDRSEKNYISEILI